MTVSPAAWLVLDRARGDLEGQIYSGVRERILSGLMPAGQRLPSTRVLATSLGVARSTVVDAYERLKSEGYVVSMTGSATRVAAFAAPPLQGRRGAAHVAKSSPPAETESGLLKPGVPDVRDFPHRQWARCLAARGRSLRIHDLGYDDGCGVLALKQAILDHVSETRGVVAQPEQVLVVSSTRMAVDLLARIVLRKDGASGGVAWIEEPGYPAAQTLLKQAGAVLVPVACDASGIDLGRASGPPPRVIYVTPSHQYPTGATMTLQRRLALLEFANMAGAVVIEDDYDSEFQYSSRPIAALQGIDRHEVVAYVGTFSKVLAPGLRVAYMILPSSLVSTAKTELQLRGGMVSVHIQAALADFIGEGRLRIYLRRMNALYATRMLAAVGSLRRCCRHRLDIADGTGGLQLAAWFRDHRINDAEIASNINALGFGLKPMSEFYLGPPRPGLLFGISRVAPDDMDAIAMQIAAQLG